MSIFKNPLSELLQYNEIEKNLINAEGPIHICGLPDSAKAHIISELGSQKRPWKLIVTYDEIHARQMVQDLSCFTDNVWYYPSRDLLFFSADIEGHVISAERINVWQHLKNEPYGLVVTVIDGLMDKLTARDDFFKSVFEIDENDTLKLEALEKKLVKFGYERTVQVDMGGQFSVRGGIIDIYPLTCDMPVRIELWGDTIDSIRTFDPESQRSVEQIHRISIYPARESLLGGTDSFLRYWDKKISTVFIDEPARVREKALAVEDEFTGSAVGRIESGQFKKEEIPQLFTTEEIMHELNSNISVFLTGLDTPVKQQNISKTYSLDAKSSATYKGAFEMLIADLKRFQENNYRIVLLSASRTRAERLAGNLREYGLRAAAPTFAYGNESQKSDAPEPAEAVGGHILVLYGNLCHGFEYPLIRFCVLCESDMFGAVRKKKHRQSSHYAGTRISSLSQLSVGDYVVHEEHGIGIYRGIEKIKRDEVTKDYIKIEYRDSAACYLPATRLDLIQKYADSEAKAPKLNRLGGVEWSRTKQKTKTAVAQIAKELITLYAERLSGKGFTYGKDTVWQKEFEELFPFEETKDQQKAIEETKSDMEEGKIMDRLICGDVGYGKTEVALRAAFKTVQEGKQVIYLVPTTILAQQHYNTFTQRMKDFPVRVDLLCRFRLPAQQKKSLEDFRKGLVDIIIGTHRVLSKDIVPHDLGLLVIDEEQRFGVTHKEKLKNLKKNVDVLTLTATPIPRTLHMSLAGIRDLSILEEPPLDRQPIQTYVCEYHDETVREAIHRETARGGQVYYVYNRVRNIADIAAHIQVLAGDAVVAYAHGQMPERELEKVMLDYINGEIDVLVTTTIIETGLDIPNVNTMIIHDADHYGLSQLYQLRGRVGRSARTAYCFLLYKRGRLLSEEAEKRLKAIREFTELGSGIKIAMRDLEIRGAGNVLGAEQHGHMQAVGYDLYCKLLNQAVSALRGTEKATQEFDTGVDIDADAYIPTEYICNEEQKLDMYKRIASIETDENYLDMQDELIDRYGEIPRAVDNLLCVARIRNLAHRVYVTDIVIGVQTTRIKLHEKAMLDGARIPELLDKYSGMLSIKTGETVIFNLSEKKKQADCRKSLEDTLHLVLDLQDYLLEKMPENA